MRTSKNYCMCMTSPSREFSLWYLTSEVTPRLFLGFLTKWRHKRYFLVFYRDFLLWLIYFPKSSYTWPQKFVAWPFLFLCYSKKMIFFIYCLALLRNFVPVSVSVRALAWCVQRGGFGPTLGHQSCDGKTFPLDSMQHIPLHICNFFEWPKYWHIVST